jgi:hypothetical protein
MARARRVGCVCPRGRSQLGRREQRIITGSGIADVVSMPKVIPRIVTTWEQAVEVCPGEAPPKLRLWITVAPADAVQMLDWRVTSLWRGDAVAVVSALGAAKPSVMLRLNPPGSQTAGAV